MKTYCGLEVYYYVPLTYCWLAEKFTYCAKILLHTCLTVAVIWIAFKHNRICDYNIYIYTYIHMYIYKLLRHIHQSMWKSLVKVSNFISSGHEFWESSNFYGAIDMDSYYQIVKTVVVKFLGIRRRNRLKRVVHYESDEQMVHETNMYNKQFQHCGCCWDLCI